MYVMYMYKMYVCIYFHLWDLQFHLNVHAVVPKLMGPPKPESGMSGLNARAHANVVLEDFQNGKNQRFGVRGERKAAEENARTWL